MKKYIGIIIFFHLLFFACGKRIENPLTSNPNNSSGGLIIVNIIDGLITKEHPVTPLSDTFQVVLGKLPDADVTIGPISSADTGEVIVSPASLTFTSTNWNVPQVVTVTGVDDLIIDGFQVVQIDLGMSSSSSSIWNNLDPGDVYVSNLDDETPTSPSVVILIGDGLITDETGTTDNYNVVLNSIPLASVTINITSGDVGEVTISPASLTFMPANYDTPQLVTVTGVDDAVADGTQAVTISMGSTISTDAAWNSLAVSSVTVYNLDNDLPAIPGVIVNAGSSMLVSENNSSSSFQVVLKSQPTGNVTINVTVSDATEGTITAPFAGASGTLTFTSGNWNVPQTVTVQGVDDAVADGNQPFTIVLATTVSGDPVYNGTFNPSDVSFINIDNETPGVTVNAGSSMLVSENLNSSSFQVVLNSQPTGNVTINVTVSDATEGTITAPFAGASGTLTFTSGNWNVPQTVTVQGVDDAVADGNQPFTIVLAATVSGDPSYNGIDPNDVAFINVDNDSAGITVNVGDGLITSETGLSDIFQVVLNSQPTANVTINPIVSTDLGEVTVAPAILTFTAGNWSIPQSVTVTGVNDTLIDNTQVVTIDLGLAASADPNYNALDPGNVTVYNLDNETPAEVIYFSDMPLVTTENGGEVVLKVILNKQPANNVVLSTIASLDATEGIVIEPSGGTLTFTPTDWNIPHIIKIQGQQDVDAVDTLYNVDLGTTASADSNWNGINPGDVTLTNKNFITVGTYIRTSVIGSFNTISATGIPITFFWLDPYTPYAPTDEGYYIAPIGFNFSFMGKYYSQVFIYTNGFVSFSNEIYNINCFANILLFQVFGTNEFVDIVAPWWDDLNTATGNVYYYATGTLGNRVFTIEWNTVRAVGGDDTFTFQLKLYETSNTIEFIYGNKTTPTADDSTASIGLKDDASINPSNYWLDGFTGTTGNNVTYVPTNYGRTSANFPALNTVIRFTLP